MVNQKKKLLQVDKAHSRKFLSIVCPFHDWGCEDALDLKGMLRDFLWLCLASFYLQKS